MNERHQPPGFARQGHGQILGRMELLPFAFGRELAQGKPDLFQV